MNKVPVILLFIISMASAAFGYEVKVVSLTGFVQVKQPGGAAWTKAVINQKIDSGYTIYTALNSSAIIQTSNATIEIKQLTQAELSSLITEGSRNVSDIYLKYGRIKADVQKNPQTTTIFKVRSANSTASVRGTSFEFGDDTLFVERGTVILQGINNSFVLVENGEQAHSSKFSLTETPIIFKLRDYIVEFRNSGTEDGEEGFDIMERGSPFKPGKVIIKIKVKK